MEIVYQKINRKIRQIKIENRIELEKKIKNYRQSIL